MDAACRARASRRSGGRPGALSSRGGGGAFAGQGAFPPGTLGTRGRGGEGGGEWGVGSAAAALDAGLSLPSPYYHRHTVNALFPVDLPPSNGFGAQLENVGELSAGG